MPIDRIKQVLGTYNVVWNSPSDNSGQSMPCGGGDIGLNVWVENGDLLIYLAKSGTYDELNRMPKLGRIRLTLSPNPFDDPSEFRQELNLYDGCVNIVATSNDLKVSVEVWVEVARPIVHVSVRSDHATTLVAAYEGWRLEKREFAKAEHHSARSWAGAPKAGHILPDVVEFDGNAVRFVHRNMGRNAFDLCVEQQGLTPIRGELINPLQDLTYGGEMSGDNLTAIGTRDGIYASTPYTGWRLRSRNQSTAHSVRVALHAGQTPSLGDWRDELSEIQSESWNDPQARTATLQWWHDFWKRSHIFIDADAADANAPQWQVGRNYALMHYQLACNARGTWPTKFNGGLFTFDPEFVDDKKKFDPDFRQWGGGTFTAQNQRLVYWPLLKSGDIDLMKPAFDFYLRNLQNAEARAKHYWNIDGACFTEQIECFGLPVAFEYGWKRPNDFEPGIEHNAWVSYQWDTVFEFCLMMLEAHAYTHPVSSPPHPGESVRVEGSEFPIVDRHSVSASEIQNASAASAQLKSLPPHLALSPEYGGEGKSFDIRAYLPLIESCLRFYDAFYRDRCKRLNGSELDENGKLRIYPGTACETYKDAVNPSSTLSALRVVLMRLIALPDDLLTPEKRARWQSMLATIPDIAFREINGHQTISPAWGWSHKQNCELPQLYPVYPYGLFGVGRPNLDVAINTWKHGIDAPDQKHIQSWHQDAIFCARLGLTDEAAALTIEKLKDSPRRFPTFWGPGHDWVPDHNWGGSGMIGLQEMLLQCVDDKLYLLPAWPKDWDVEFKLHAAHCTTIECVYRAGKIQSLTVTPKDRERDVVLPE